MKLFKTASGQDMLSIDKEEWARIGMEKGWMKMGSSGSAKCRICGFNAELEQFMDDAEDSCPQCGSTYLDKFQ
jgi:rubrerythrin